jgi:hypothetical protein
MPLVFFFSAHLDLRLGDIGHRRCASVSRNHREAHDRMRNHHCAIFTVNED